MPYVIIIVLGLLLVILEHRNKRLRYLQFFIFFTLCLSMVIIGGLRTESGFDTITYTKIFNGMPKLGLNFIESSSSWHGEIGFKILIGLLKSIGVQHVQVLFIVIILVSIVLIYKALKEYTSYPYLGFYLYTSMYFFGRDMGQIRQAIATAICFYSIKYIRTRSMYKFLIVVLIASSFHVSSMVLIPMYFIADKEIKKMTYVSIISFGVLLTNIDWLRNNIGIVEKLLTFELPYVYGKHGYAIQSIFTLQYLRRFLPAALIIIGHNKLKSKYEYFNIVSNIYISGLFLSLLFHEVAIYVERLFVPMLFTEILILGYFIGYLDNKYLKLFYKFFVILYVTFYFSNLMINNMEVFFPYRNILGAI